MNKPARRDSEFAPSGAFAWHEHCISEARAILRAAVEEEREFTPAEDRKFKTLLAFSKLMFGDESEVRRA